MLIVIREVKMKNKNNNSKQKEKNQNRNCPSAKEVNEKEMFCNVNGGSNCCNVHSWMWRFR